MCLVINHKFHKRDQNFYIPRIAEIDLLVNKDLCRIARNFYISPAFNAKYLFHKGVCVVESEFGFGDYSEIKDMVYEGIHSYINYSFLGGTKFRAIIPKGTKYFVGMMGDIVSTKLIVFKTYFSFLKYKITHRNIAKASF